MKMSEPATPTPHHEKTPSTPSIKSSLSVPPRDGLPPRRVGFQKPRPTLKIPSPLASYGPRSATFSVVSGAPSTHTTQSYGFYGKKQSIFMFNGIKDFTKSGLGVGEKSALWLYTKLRAWSKKWFTHFFLTIVLVIYTIGGALIFVAVEGYNEDKIVIPNLQRERYSLIRSIRDSASTIPDEKSEKEFEGEAYRQVREFEGKLIESFLKDQLIVANGGDRKIWTFWNAVVFCSTVYTSIGLPNLDLKINSLHVMESLETSTAETTQNDVDISRIEAMVTPEQVFSANVARKRRSFTKKQSANFHRTRELTPARDLMSDNDINEDIHREKTVIHPATPERPRRKTKSVERNSASKNISVERETSIPKNFFGDLRNKTENFAELAHNEFNNILSKTKKGISSAASGGRKLQRKSKKDNGRSLSAPYQFTEEEILESFRRKNLIDGIERSSSFKRLSNTSSTRSISPEADIRKPREFRPEVRELFRQKRRLRSRSKSNISNKIIEILDPKTRNVVHTKTLLKGNVGLKELLIVLKTFKISEIREEYKSFKVEMQEEILRIKNMRNSCFNELFIVILFCSIGGFLFKFTEGSFENFYKCGVKRVKRDFIDLLWVKSHNLREEDWKSLARNRLRIFEEELHAAHEAGMTSYSGQRSWSFLNGIVYSITVISTIGYGHIYPTTLTGRALTIVYSLIGIPLFLLALTDFGKLFTRCIKFLWSFVRRLYYTGSCRRVRKQAQVQEIFKGAQMMYDFATFRRPSAVWDPEDPQQVPTTLEEETPTTPALSNFEIDDQFNLPISIAILILLLYIFFGAFFYGFMEGWNFFKSFYFVFISMSTIGFGDVVPNNPLCTIISIVYLVFGLALMSMCINVVQEKLSDTFKSASAKIGASMGIGVAAEDGSIVTVPPDQVEMPPVHEKIDSDDTNVEDDEATVEEVKKT